MDFLDLAKKRYSVRTYEDKVVEEEKVLKILEAGRVAPTGANTQSQRLVVVQTKEGLEKIKKAANISGAPMAIIVCGDHKSVWKRPYDHKDILDIDAGIVISHMMLEATDLGLGTVCVCYFDPTILRGEFNIPENVEAVAIIGIGYPAGKIASPDRHDKARKPLNAIAIYESF